MQKTIAYFLKLHFLPGLEGQRHFKRELKNFQIGAHRISGV